jgi:hypothetical protein
VCGSVCPGLVYGHTVIAGANGVLVVGCDVHFGTERRSFSDEPKSFPPSRAREPFRCLPGGAGVGDGAPLRVEVGAGLVVRVGAEEDQLPGGLAPCHRSSRGCTLMTAYLPASGRSLYLSIAHQSVPGQAVQHDPAGHPLHRVGIAADHHQRKSAQLSALPGGEGRLQHIGGA